VHPQYIRNTDSERGVCSQCPVSYAVDMTTKGTPGRMIRVDDETWAAFGEVCDAKGLSRAADLRVYIKAQVAAHRKRLRAEQSSD
jgi:hypothetical protein